MGIKLKATKPLPEEPEYRLPALQPSPNPPPLREPSSVPRAYAGGEITTLTSSRRLRLLRGLFRGEPQRR
ncbi:MAG: hypothetical protein ACRDK4_05770 [Solirubrobacteraceae bacterium]